MFSLMIVVVNPTSLNVRKPNLLAVKDCWVEGLRASPKQDLGAAQGITVAWGHCHHESSCL
jgi:hypothetical protein